MRTIHPATWLLGILIILSTFDFACTYVIIENGGRELNPIMNYIMQAAGTTWALLWAKWSLLSIVVVLYTFNNEFKRKWQSPVMIGAAAVANICYLSVVTYSFHMIWVNDIWW